MILGEFVAIEFHAETRSFRNSHLSARELELSSRDYVIREVVIMRIGCGNEIRQRRGQMQHGGLRYAEFGSTMHADIDAHGFTQLTGQPRAGDASVPVRVEEHDVENIHDCVGNKVLKGEHRHV